MRFRRYAGIAALAVLTVLAAHPNPAGAQATNTNGSVRVLYKVPPSINLTIATNYQSGYGPTGGTGSGTAVAAGSTAASGVVDFGTVVQGYNYLYKYAAQVSVTTNDSSGFSLYAEGSADFNASIPVANSLFWMLSGTGNTQYTGAPTAHSFQTTASPVTIPGANNATTIAYPGGLPPASALIWHYPSTTIGQPGNAVSQGYDYKMSVPAAASISTYSIYIVYTAVAS
jgi:hypothetical protein